MAGRLRVVPASVPFLWCVAVLHPPNPTETEASKVSSQKIRDLLQRSGRLAKPWPSSFFNQRHISCWHWSCNQRINGKTQYMSGDGVIAIGAWHVGRSRNLGANTLLPVAEAKLGAPRSAESACVQAATKAKRAQSLLEDWTCWRRIETLQALEAGVAFWGRGSDRTNFPFTSCCDKSQHGWKRSRAEFLQKPVYPGRRAAILWPIACRDLSCDWAALALVKTIHWTGQSADHLSLVHVLLATGPAFRVHHPMKNHFVCYWHWRPGDPTPTKSDKSGDALSNSSTLFSTFRCVPSNEHFPMGTITSMFCLCNICASPRRNLSHKCTRWNPVVLRFVNPFNSVVISISAIKLSNCIQFHCFSHCFWNKMPAPHPRLRPAASVRLEVKGLAVCNEPSRFIPADVLAGFYDQAPLVLAKKGSTYAVGTKSMSWYSIHVIFGYLCQENWTKNRFEGVTDFLGIPLEFASQIMPPISVRLLNPWPQKSNP